MSTRGEGMVSPTVELSTIAITPAIASSWLSANMHNRSLKPVVVARLAGAMSRGEWRLNGETIKFGPGGLIGGLIDGQHRLAAVVASGVTISSVVVRGLNASAQETVDIGTKRSTGDLLRLRGEQNANTLGAALVQLWRYRQGYPMGVSGGTLTPTAQEQMHLLDLCPSLRDSLKSASVWQERLRYPHGLAAALHFVCSEINLIDADYFFARVGDGAGLTYGDPKFTLREALLADIVAPRRMLGTRRAAIVIRAWNAYRDGEKLTRLHWNATGNTPDAFPTPR